MRRSCITCITSDILLLGYSNTIFSCEKTHRFTCNLQNLLPISKKLRQIFDLILARWRPQAIKWWRRGFQQIRKRGYSINWKSHLSILIEKCDNENIHRYTFWLEFQKFWHPIRLYGPVYSESKNLYVPCDFFLSKIPIEFSYIRNYQLCCLDTLLQIIQAFIQACWLQHLGRKR